MRYLGLAVAATVIAAAATTHPSPGLHGRGLAVLITLCAFGAGAVAAVALRHRPEQRVVAVAVWIAGAIALTALQPNGPGWLAFFSGVGAAAVSLPFRAAAWFFGISLVAVAIGLIASGAPWYPIVLTVIGASGFFFLSLLVVRLREANERTASLVKELEESRDAQAQAVALRERARIARDMHDVLAHSLSGLALQLEGARLLVRERGADPEVMEAVERAHRLARAGVDEARGAIGALRGDELPGPEGLESLVAGLGEELDIPYTYEVEGVEPSLSPEARATLFRTAQEALTNVRKHARPDRVELRLAYAPDGACLRVEDFGRNGDAPRPMLSETGGGYGLTGMRERAELLGGRLHAGSTPTGFRVELWVPA
jgi:signal transduction histidine kinase